MRFYCSRRLFSFFLSTFYNMSHSSHSSDTKSDSETGLTATLLHDFVLDAVELTQRTRLLQSSSFRGLERGQSKCGKSFLLSLIAICLIKAHTSSTFHLANCKQSCRRRMLITDNKYELFPSWDRWQED